MNWLVGSRQWTDRLVSELTDTLVNSKEDKLAVNCGSQEWISKWTYRNRWSSRVFVSCFLFCLAMCVGAIICLPKSMPKMTSGLFLVDCSALIVWNGVFYQPWNSSAQLDYPARAVWLVPCFWLLYTEITGTIAAIDCVGAGDLNSCLHV